MIGPLPSLTKQFVPVFYAPRGFKISLRLVSYNDTATFLPPLSSEPGGIAKLPANLPDPNDSKQSSLESPESWSKVKSNAHVLFVKSRIGPTTQCVLS